MATTTYIATRPSFLKFIPYEEYFANIITFTSQGFVIKFTLYLPIVGIKNGKKVLSTVNASLILVHPILGEVVCILIKHFGRGLPKFVDNPRSEHPGKSELKMKTITF